MLVRGIWDFCNIWEHNSFWFLLFLSFKHDRKRSPIISDHLGLSGLMWTSSRTSVMRLGIVFDHQGFLTLTALCISENYFKIEINLNFCFRTSLWSLKRFYEGLQGLHKTFWGTTKMCENKNLSQFFLFLRYRDGKSYRLWSQAFNLRHQGVLSQIFKYLQDIWKIIWRHLCWSSPLRYL